MVVTVSWVLPRAEGFKRLRAKRTGGVAGSSQIGNRTRLASRPRNSGCSLAYSFFVIAFAFFCTWYQRQPHPQN